MTDKALFVNKLEKAFSLNSLSEFITEEITDKLLKLTDRMLEVNEYMNLTAITDLDGIITKHYTDSLTASSYIPRCASIIDVGCGAGFPSLVLAVARPDLTVTALDSTAKRIRYIEETADILGLNNINCIAARAEELSTDQAYREKYDVACARAVARLNVLSELCIPFVKPDGRFVAMKANADDEVSEAASAIEKLGGKLLTCDHLSLITEVPNEDNPRCIVVIEKIKKTPAIYPRNNSQIKKKPL